MNAQRIKAVIRKDIREVAAQRMVWIPMIVVPLLLVVLLPAVLLAVFTFSEAALDAANLGELEELIPFYRPPSGIADATGQVLYVVLNYTFLPFFLIVPLMTATIVAANAFVGEKERRTLETLLYTPITNGELLIAKVLSALVPAVGVGWLAFVVYFGVTNAFYLSTQGTWIVGAWIWVPTLLLLVPAIAFAGLTASVMASLKAKSFMEAQQIAGVVVLPLVALIVSQVMGLFVLRPWHVAAGAVVLSALIFVLLKRLAPRLSRERLISTL